MATLLLPALRYLNRTLPSSWSGPCDPGSPRLVRLASACGLPGSHGPRRDL